MPDQSNDNKSNGRSAKHGRKLYSKMVRMFREGFVSIVVYKNAHERACYYDVVIYRKVKVNGKNEYRRGANFKPSDMPALISLMTEVDVYLSSFHEES